jgi:hypothetical protein
VIEEAWAKDHPTPPDLDLWSSCGATDAQATYWGMWLDEFKARYQEDQKAPQDNLANQQAAGNA